MEEESLRLASAKAEPPLQFLFVNEVEENNSNSSYGFAVRSHIRKRHISERRRRDAAPKLHPQRLLPKASSGVPINIDTLTTAPIHLIPRGNKVITPGSPTRSDFNVLEIEGQSRIARDGGIRNATLSNTPHIVGPKEASQKERANRRKIHGEMHTLQQASLKGHGSHKSAANLHAHRMRPAGTNVGSPVSMLGSGKIDPFRSYPADADRHEHWLIDYCKSFPFSVSVFLTNEQN